MMGRTFIAAGSSAFVHGAIVFSIARMDLPAPELALPDAIEVALIELPDRDPPPREEEAAPEPEEPTPEVEAAPNVTPTPPRPRPSRASKAPSGGVPPVRMGGEARAPAGSHGGGGGDPDAPPERRHVEKQSRTLGDARDDCTAHATKARAHGIPKPSYPSAARAAGIEGKVRVEVVVGSRGEIERTTVIDSLDPDLDAAAVRAVRQGKFDPATRCGQPIAATLKVAVTFSI